MPKSAAGRSEGYSSYVDDDVYSVVSVESALDRAQMVAHRLEVRTAPSLKFAPASRRTGKHPPARILPLPPVPSLTLSSALLSRPSASRRCTPSTPPGSHRRTTAPTPRAGARTPHPPSRRSATSSGSSRGTRSTRRAGAIGSAAATSPTAAPARDGRRAARTSGRRARRPTPDPNPVPATRPPPTGAPDTTTRIR